MKMKLLLFFTVPLFFVGLSFGQESPKGYDCALLDSKTWNNQEATIYEDATNIFLPVDFKQNFNKKYYFIPNNLYIDKSSAEIKSIDSKQSSIYFEIISNEISTLELAKHLKYNGNPDIRQGNINPGCVFGYEVIYNDKVIYKDSANVSMNNTILVDTKVSKSIGDELKSRLNSGKGIKFRYYVKVMTVNNSPSNDSKETNLETRSSEIVLKLGPAD